jgi:hypothetical protein
MVDVCMVWEKDVFFSLCGVLEHPKGGGLWEMPVSRGLLIIKFLFLQISREVFQ